MLSQDLFCKKFWELRCKYHFFARLGFLRRETTRRLNQRRKENGEGIVETRHYELVLIVHPDQ